MNAFTVKILYRKQFIFLLFFLSKCPLEIKVYKGGRSRIVFLELLNYV